MIFQIQESIKMDDVKEEASSNIINPPKCRKISFSQSIPRKDYQSGSSKDYKTYDKRQPIDELRILSTASQLGSILNLTAWDP